jgi:predicted RNase H-like HicB family nuclease
MEVAATLMQSPLDNRFDALMRQGRILPMLYPICIHQEDNGSLGATIPDFPGCFSGADDWRELPRMVQEAIEVHCEGEDFEIPAPSSLDELRDNPDYEGGQWVFIDVDLGALDTRKERINLSVPVYALREIDSYVQARGGSRSGFMVTAALSVARGRSR